MGIKGNIITTIIIWLLVAGIFYLMHPALNFHLLSFWGMIIIVIAALTVTIGMFASDEYDLIEPRVGLGGVVAGGIVIIFCFVMGLVSTPLFSSEPLSTMIAPQDSTFDEHSDDFQISAIPLMDTESAKLFGNRELGGLADVVSQFDDDPNYHQISYKNVPTKVSAVDYAGFFRWTANNTTGAPGYISVDPIDQSADYIALKDENGEGFGNLIYTDGAFFNEDISRHVQFQYPTYSLGSSRFELDEDGHPYYVTQYYSYRTFFGGKDTEGVIITDPTNGESTDYKVGEIPEWVDDVYNGDMILTQATDHWMLANGFWNSILAKDGCRRCSDDYGYVNIDGHIWLYTGVTSANDDSSNIGFLLVSERTKEAYYIPMASADEKSAMASAEGQVQQYGYEASWPSLVSIDGQPTYVMVLKDASGVVRMYAMVNAESYNVVACDYTLDAVKAAYEKRMTESNIKFTRDNQDMPDVTGEGAENADAEKAETVEFKTIATKIILADENGNTYAYVAAADGKVYKALFSDWAVYLMAIEEGSEIEGSAHEGQSGVMEVDTFGKETKDQPAAENTEEPTNKAETAEKAE